jgi:hypothetical protein
LQINYSFHKKYRNQNIPNHLNKSNLDKNLGTEELKNFILIFVFLKNFFLIKITEKLKRTLEPGQSVQLSADIVQFPHESSQLKHSYPS